MKRSCGCCWRWNLVGRGRPAAPRQLRRGYPLFEQLLFDPGLHEAMRAPGMEPGVELLHERRGQRTSA